MLDYWCIYFTLLLLCDKINCYRTFTALNSVVFTNIDDPPDNVHSEYYFGRCATRHKTLLHQDSYTYDYLKGKILIRRWVPYHVEPTCVYIRGRSAYGDIIRYHAMKFGFCLCSVVYNYMGDVYEYKFYEWYIPVEMHEGVEWEIYFYKDIFS